MRAATAALGVALALVTTPASATVTPGSVTVADAAKQTSDLQMLGLSGNGVATTRDGHGVLAAPTGFQSLLDFGATYHAPADGTRVSDLTGNILRWAEPKGSAWVIHQQGAFSGDPRDFASVDKPLAFTPDSWIGYRNGTLTKHVFAGASTTLLTGLTGVPEVRADAKGAAVLYQAGNHTRVGLVTFGKAGVDVLADPQPGEELPTAIALTPNSVVWFAEYQPVNILGVVHRRARAGGAVSSVQAPPAARTGEEIAATDTTVALTRIQRYRTDVGDSSVRLYALRGSTWQNIVLPGQDDVSGTPFSSTFGGLRATADTIAFALGGDDRTVTGVYTVDGDASPALFARVPATGVISDVSLQAGRVTFAEDNQLQRSTVSTSGALTAGAPAAFVPGVVLDHTREPGPTTAFSVSGDRVVARTGGHARQFMENRYFTGQTPELPTTELPVKRSGDYVLVDHHVYQGDELTPVLDLTSRKCRDEDIFGSLVVCNQPDGKNVMIDAAGRFPTGTTTGPGTGEVAIWGTAVAWVSSGQISVQDLDVAGSLRSFPVSGRIHDLRLGEGAVGWTTDDGYLMTADRANLTPVPTGLRAPGDLDDHLVAGLTGDGDLRVQTLPSSTTRYRPRLFDAAAPASFDASVLPWRPVFDATKPLTNVKLVIKRGTTVITTLTGSGAVGTVRDVTWSGKTAAGAWAPAGAYQWTLTADARDGDGALAGVDGTSAISGSVNLTYS